ncbi:hypothetical protein [Loigolactobacillus coryniformis]|jgi:hypothetical protein|uniref:hypothetical protein n=1 Tax=Loigolactobacillus coryniformis TaxID=1610 RepID=UPI001C5F5FFE|nr:hypothetical protein [Loigolactobacillus coryniformis]MBW4802110.1 hypothetical protein [Loigolactobacillus coryniformis subsp. torquens]MBW4806387.1 hypothetical protein [Loigolactobacillus coryniformis subsp. torquens]
MINDTSFEVFRSIALAFRRRVMIEQPSAQDKEFHFQNWVESRLEEFTTSTGIHFEASGRNVYPDFSLVEQTLGFEVKGLAYPGREKNYDANSDVPCGFHNGRSIYYVFGRYPKDTHEFPLNANGNREYPVLDLMVVHGDFLNSQHGYVHKNKHVNGFGSYGDIMIRDRKMYVVPTPYFLTKGTYGTATLIQPSEITTSSKDFVKVGTLSRTENDKQLSGYAFDLTSNRMTTQTIVNKNSGIKHTFDAYVLRSADLIKYPVVTLSTEG